MSGDDFREKRTYTRFEVNIPVNYFIHDQSEPVYFGKTRDISPTGLGLLCEQDAGVRQGISLDICIRVPDSQYLKLKGRVVWTSATVDGKYRIGIELEGEKLKPIPILLQVIRSQKGI